MLSKAKEEVGKKSQVAYFKNMSPLPEPSEEKPFIPDSWPIEMAKILRRFDDKLLTWKEHPNQEEYLQAIEEETQSIEQFLKEHEKEILQKGKKNGKKKESEELLATAYKMISQLNREIEGTSLDILKVALRKLLHIIQSKGG